MRRIPGGSACAVSGRALSNARTSTTIACSGDRRTMARSRARIVRPHQPAPARVCLSGAGHSQRPFLARGVPDPLFSPGSATWPNGSGSSLLPSGGAPGVLPFAGLLPSAGGRAGYQSRGSACDIAALRCASASHALRASLLVRAHVPVDRVIPSAPRLIFVGEAASSDDRPGTFDSIRLLGFVPAGGPFRQRPMTSSSARRRSFLPWALPLSGLRSRPFSSASESSGWTRPPRRFRLCAIAVRARPRFPRHQPPARGSPAGLSARGRYGVLPGRAIASNDHGDHSPSRRSGCASCRGCFRPGETRLPFSVLWG